MKKTFLFTILFLLLSISAFALEKNVASQKWVIFCFDDTDNSAKTGDAAQITANVRIDGGAANGVDDTNPTELEDGYYIFDISQAESNGENIVICPDSSTANIQCIGCPMALWTRPPAHSDFITPPTASAVVNEWETQSQADPTGFHVNVYEIGGTAQTANDNGADVNAILTDTDAQDTSTELRTLLTGADTAVSTVTTAQINSECDTALLDINLDHLLKTALPTGPSTDIALDSAIGCIMDAGTTWTYNRTADALEVGGGSCPTVSQIADAVWDETSTGHVDAGKAGQQLWTDVDAILTDTAVIGALGAGLTAIPWNSSWDAEVESEVDDSMGGGTGTALTAIPWNSSWDTEVQSECDDALTNLNLDHLCKIAVDINWATTVHLDSVIGHIADDGTAATFNRVGDSLEDLRDQGDAAWVTATGFSTLTASDNIGINWGDVSNPTTVINLSGTTIKTATDVESDTNAILIDTAAQDTSTELRTLLTGADTPVSVVTTGNLDTACDTVTVTSMGANVITDAACAADFDILVNDEMADVLKTDVMSEATAMSEFPATGTMEDALRLRYMIDRNATGTTSSEHRLKNSAGTVILEYDIADDGTTFTRSKARDDN